VRSINPTALSLNALLTIAETRLLTEQRIEEDDWQRLLDAGADTETLYDLLRRSDRPSLRSLGNLTKQLHKSGHTQQRTLTEVMKRALKGGLLEPHVHVLRLLCAAPVPPGGQTGNAVVDSQVLCDLIEELYFDPAHPRSTAEAGIAYRGFEELYRSRKKLTVAGLDAVKALRPRLKKRSQDPD